MKRLMTVTLGVATMFVLSAGARADEAAERAQAKALLGEGLQLLDQHDYQGALERFERAYKVVPSPKIHFNLGEAHLGLGEEPEALASFERFLDEVPSAPPASRSAARRKRDALRRRLGFVDAIATESGTTVLVDGKEAGKTPLARAIAVKPGDHDVAFKKEGYEADTRSVVLRAGETLRITARLQPVPAVVATPLPPPPAKPGPPPVESPTLALPRGAAPPDDASTITAQEPRPVAVRRERWQRPTTWVVGGAAAVSLAFGTTMQALSSSKNADFNAVKDAPHSSTMECNDKIIPDGGGPECERLRGEADRYHRMAIIGFVAGGLLAIGSIVLFVVSAQEADADRRQTWRCGSTGSAVHLELGCSVVF
jgi:hypothetical protein